MSSKKSNEDAFNRMNFLYQAAGKCLKMQTEQSVRMAAYYGMLLRGVGKKAQVRMDPSMKRTLCKGCHVILVPGVTATVRLQKKPAARITWLCKHCSTIKRFNLRKDYKIWVEHDEAIVCKSNNNNNSKNKPAGFGTDKSFAESSAIKAENIKSNRDKQNKTENCISVNKAKLIETSVFPTDRNGDNTVIPCDTISVNNIKMSNIEEYNFNRGDKHIENIVLSDVGTHDKIDPCRRNSKQCDVDPADELKVGVSDIRLYENNPFAVDINMPNGSIKQYGINSMDEVSDIKPSEINMSDIINTFNNDHRLYNNSTEDKFEDICGVTIGPSINTYNSDCKCSSSNDTVEWKESVSDVEPSGNSNHSVGLCKSNKIVVLMDVESSETNVDKAMDIDNSDIVEDKH